MEYNLLDRIYDEDNYGNNSAEFLLRGMSPEGQKRFIKDLSKSLAKKIVPGAGSATKAERRKFAEELESSINRMPEELQDSWLISAGKPRTVYFDNSVENFNQGSGYYPETNKIVIRPTYNRPVESVIHEVGHHADFNLDPKTFVFEYEDGPAKKSLVSAAARSDIGRKVRNELINGNFDKKLETETDILKGIEGVNRNIKDAIVLGKLNIPSKDYTVPLETEIGASIGDWYSLGTDLNFDYVHPSAYRKAKRAEAYKLFTDTPNLMEAGFAARRLPYEKQQVLFRKVLDYPISIETPSNIYNIIGKGGYDWLEKYAPETMQEMNSLASKDVRKKRYVPRHEKYADELGMELIAKNRERAAKRKQTLLDRYRVDFMTLPEEKRNYYENAKPGDVLWLKSPEFEEGQNQYYVIKGDPHYEERGSKLYKVHDDIGLGSGKKGRFKKVLKPIDLNELAPDFVPTDKFDVEFPQYESKNVLEMLERRRKRKAK